MAKNNLLMIGLLAATSFAQTAATPAKPKTAAPVKPASQTVNTPTSTPTKTAPAKTAAKPASTPKTTATKAPAPKPVQKKATPAQVKADIEAKAAKPAAAKTEAPVKTAGRRDPFVSPLRLQEDKMRSSSVCTTGARCLVVDQVVLKGIVKTPQGMIAMVENPSQKQYNLREKDPVYNGQVVKITQDSVIFRETVTDNMGKQTTREVVKKVTAPVI